MVAAVIANWHWLFLRVFPACVPVRSIVTLPAGMLSRR